MVLGLSHYGRERDEQDLAHSHSLTALRLGFRPTGAMECFVALTATVRASADGSGALSKEVALRIVTASEAAVAVLKRSGKKLQHAHTLNVLLCSLSLSQKQWKRVISLCKAATISNPLEETSAVRLGNAYLGRGTLAKAQQVFDAADRKFKGLCEQCGGQGQGCCLLMDTIVAGARADWQSVYRGNNQLV